MPRRLLTVSESVWRVLNPASRSTVARSVSAEISEMIRSTVGLRFEGCGKAGEDAIAAARRRIAGNPARRASESESGFLRKNLFVVLFVLVDNLLCSERL